jgi:hypothetical protein
VTRFTRALALVTGSLALVVFSCGPRDVQTSEALVGHWDGHLTYRSRSMWVVLDIVRRDGRLFALMSAPDLLAREWPAGEVTYRPPKLRFTLPVGRESWAFEGWFRRSLIVGNLLNQGIVPGESRALLPQLALRKVTRLPEPFAVDTMRVGLFPRAATVRLFNPYSPAPHPAMLLVPGGPAQPALGLAELFAREGFVVMVGEGEAALVRAELHALRTRPDVDSARVGLWTEGRGVETTLGVATSERAAFVLATAPVFSDTVRRRAPGSGLSALLVYGERDSTRRLAPALPGVRVSAQVFPRADRALFLALLPGERFDFPRLAPGYADSLVAFARRHAGLGFRQEPLVPQSR